MQAVKQEQLLKSGSGSVLAPVTGQRCGRVCGGSGIWVPGDRG